MIISHSNKTHEKTANLAEGSRQQAVQAAILAGGGSAAVKAAVAAAEAVFFRAIIASCDANGIEAGGFRQGLHDITGQYS